MNLDWMAAAACLEVDPEAFSPLPSDDPSDAKIVCLGETVSSTRWMGCPVRAECFAYANTTNQEGVWGGLTDEERKALRPPHPAHPKRPNDPTWDAKCGSEAGVGVHRRKREALCVACRAANNAAKQRARVRKREEANR